MTALHLIDRLSWDWWCWSWNYFHLAFATKKIMMKNFKLKFSEYMQKISSSKSFGKFFLIVGTTNTGKMIESNILFIYCRCARRPPWKTVAQWLIGALQHTGKTCLQWIRAFTASFWADSPANYWCGKHDLSQF